MDLEKLKVKMILHFPFFGALLHNLEHISSERYPTAATDGRNVYYNPKFMDSLPQEEQLFIVAHELLHAAFLHINRWKQHAGNQESQMVWNIAGDLLINDLLVNEQHMTMPKCGIIDSKYKFMDFTIEALYRELMKNATQIKVNDSGTGEGAGAGNDIVMGDGESQSPAEQAAEEKKWTMAVNEAAIIAKQAGNCPASIERLISELLKPKVDWKDALANWFNHKIKENNDWNSPNRRFVQQGIYFPSKRTEHIGHIAVAIDTSGSIGEYELNAFGSELNYIFETAKPSKVTVIYCDCQINRTEEFKAEDFPLVLRPYGGGGTSFKPPFEWVKKKLENDIAGLVYMTDMYGDFPSKAPEYPVLWMATSNIKAPFGDTVEYNIERT